MKGIIFICFLSLSGLTAHAQRVGSELGVQLTDLSQQPTAVELVEQARLRTQTVDIRDKTIVLDLYTGISVLDTIIEQGRYQLLIKHDKDIMQFDIRKNNKPVKRIERKDNKVNALHKGLRTALRSPLFRFRKNTAYNITIQLEGEIQPRAFRIRTRNSDIQKPFKEEMGTPI